MSTDLESTCPTQDSIGAFVQTAPGFSVAFFIQPFKLVNTPVTVVISPVIANSPSSTDYNSGMYNPTTGIITVPKTGLWIINQTFANESGNDPYLSYVLTGYNITGFTGTVQFFNTNDKMVSGEDSSNARSDSVYLVKGTTIQLDAEYTLTGNPGVVDLGIRFSMQLVSEL